MTPEEEQYVVALENEYKNAVTTTNQSYPMSTSAMFANQNKQNLVEWQLDFRPELEDIERLLRGDVLIKDKEGNELWVKNPNRDYVLFNDLGVSDITREIRMFLNKNTVLSYYREEDVKARIRQFGHALRELIYVNSERYGLDNEYKINNYAIIVLTILSMIESSFRRAINGEERKGLGEARIVQQNDSLNMQGMQMPQMRNHSQNKQDFISKIMPWNWGK